MTKTSKESPKRQVSSKSGKKSVVPKVVDDSATRADAISPPEKSDSSTSTSKASSLPNDAIAKPSTVKDASFGCDAIPSKSSASTAANRSKSTLPSSVSSEDGRPMSSSKSTKRSGTSEKKQAIAFSKTVAPEASKAPTFFSTSAADYSTCASNFSAISKIDEASTSNLLTDAVPESSKLPVAATATETSSSGLSQTPPDDSASIPSAVSVAAKITNSSTSTIQLPPLKATVSDNTNNSPWKGTTPSSLPAPVWIPLDNLENTTTFRLRPEGDVETLATSIVREGQIFPIHVRPTANTPGHFQVVDGFRRVAALRLIMRRRVLAHIHVSMSDEDALSFAMAALLESKTPEKSDLESLKTRLTDENRLTSAADEALTRAIAPENLELADETIDCAKPEPDPCALVDAVLSQMGALNRDLMAIARCWDVLPRDVRNAILQQLNYSAEMSRYLRRLPGGFF